VGLPDPLFEFSVVQTIRYCAGGKRVRVPQLQGFSE
jgi:hypothetical protein